MSKSKGIGLDPNDLVKDRGAEIARLLVSSVNFVEDVRIFDELLDNLGLAYRKIRNTCRFMLGNLSNSRDPENPRFDPAKDAVAYEEMLEIDRWALARTSRLIRRCLKGYEDYQFHQVYNALYNFCTVDMSAFYFDILKDRLYTHPTKSHSRRSAQTALRYILDALAKLLAPILSFTMEEVWRTMHEGNSETGSIHVEQFPRYCEQYDQEPLLREWEEIARVRDAVSKALEEVRQSKLIGAPLEAKVILRAGAGIGALLRKHAAELRYVFIVSQVELEDDPEASSPQDVKVRVERASGGKCERCWNYSIYVGKDHDFPTLCERCVPVVRGMNGSL
jgi:isoleucyl-tRNA synthetase